MAQKESADEEEIGKVLEEMSMEKSN